MASFHPHKASGSVPARRRSVTTVHTRGAGAPVGTAGGSLDGMLGLQECASAEGTLEEVLAAVADRIAALLGVEVCSIYLRDEGDELVLSATHGFPQDAVGQVRMRVGEGLTGFAVECLRPVSVAMATDDARNKSFDGLPDENYPALCALPLVDAGRAAGAMVVQRKQPRAFGEHELVLIAAMAPVVLFAVERARRRQSEAKPQESPRSHRVASLAVRGAPAAPGRAVGTVAIHRAPISHPHARAFDPGDEQQRLERAFVEVASEVAELDTWARKRLAEVPPSADSSVGRLARARLLGLRFVLDDARLQDRALRHVLSGAAATAAIERVAREYARVLGSASDEALQERAIELEALCGRLLARLSRQQHEPEPNRVLVAARLTVFEAVELAKNHGAAAVLSMPAEASPGIDVARAIGLPVVSDVRALFRWAHDGDRALVDGTQGTLLINPPRSDVAALRREKRG